jgi:hypothetical protein
MTSLTLARDGAQLLPSAIDASTLAAIVIAPAGQPRDRAGLRLRGGATLSPPLSSNGAVGRLAAEAIGAEARPVRAILFDKSPAANWALGWHQDRTIAVRERRDVRWDARVERESFLPIYRP